MSNDKKETLENKKEKLESELKAIQDELDDSVEKVKAEVSSSINPLDYARKYPLPAVGVAALLGFLYSTGSKAGEGGASPAEKSESSTEKFTSTMWYEVKRLAARKALSMVGDYLDDIF